VEGVLLTLRPSPPLAMTRGLEARSDFALVYFDDRAAVWVRSLPRYADLIARRRYSFLSPLSIGRRRIDADSAPAAAAEALRATADCEQCLVARSALAEATLMRGDLDAARTQFEELAGIAPDLYLARLRLGDILGLRGDVAGAEARYREALTLSPDDPYIAAQLAALRRDGRVPAVAVLGPETPPPPPPAVLDPGPLP
jgi:tetratricopeptide (TPR) repeat protein